MNQKQYPLMYHLEDHHWWFLAKREFVKTILPTTKQSLKILDLGSGTGGMTKFISKWGAVTAVENSPYALPFLKKRKIIPKNISINNCVFKNNSFDLVCLFDVLYHHNIANDQKVIQNIYKWLKPGGHLYITDCANPFLFSHHDLIMQARQRYKLNELIKKIKTEKFVINKASYIFFFTFPIFVLLRIIDKFYPLNTVTEIPDLLNKILLFICKVESHILRCVNYPFGSSLIIEAIKE